MPVNEEVENNDLDLKGFSKPLSKNIHLLGDILGLVVKEQAGEKIFEIVESIRKEAKQVRNKGNKSSLNHILNLTEPLSLQDRYHVLRAFTLYFHLVNEAEKIEIVRVNREREFHATLSPRRESIEEAIYFLKETKHSDRAVQSILDKISIEPVFTAHPTEAKRPALLRLLKEIIFLVEKYDEPERLTQRELRAIKKELTNKITLLWRMPEVRTRKPEVIEEAYNVLYHLRETVFDLVVEINDDIKVALDKYYPNSSFKTNPIINFGSWVGGDRDGNPFVTSEITKEILILSSKEIIIQYIKSVRRLRSELIITEASDELIASNKNDEKFFPERLDDEKFYHYEPYRKKLWFIEAKLKNTMDSTVTLGGNKKNYSSASDFLSELELLKDSLDKSNASTIGNDGLLAKLIFQVKTFGFHFVELDIREHSEVHEEAISEILVENNTLNKDQYKNLSELEKIDLLTKLIQENKNHLNNLALSERTKNLINTFKVISFAHEKFGKKAVRCYITSFTRGVSDLLEVIFFAKCAGLIKFTGGQICGDIDIVPLFETVDDLKNSGQTLRTLFSNELYSKYLKSRNNFQEIMLGFSDSGKDGGYLAANVQLFNAQKEMSKVCLEYGIDWRFFHGRGGSIGRGGAQAGKAIQAAPKGSVGGKIRFTEQGEVVAYRYSIPSLAHRHLEAMIHSVIISANDPYESTNNEAEIFSKLEARSKEKYINLVYKNENFWNFFSTVTPYEFISHLNIASRPTSRGNKKRIEDIRAITWGFSLTQTRLMLNSWYGVGTALDKVIAECGLQSIRELYKKNDFLKVTINNCQQALAKADMNTAEIYTKNHNEKYIGEIFTDITNEYELTKATILEITEQKEILDNKKVIQQSIKLRNPYTDPLNCIQTELLSMIKTDTQNKLIHDKNFLATILLSINGVAAAMQETG